jgi:hypothetical protein
LDSLTSGPVTKQGACLEKKKKKGGTDQEMKCISKKNIEKEIEIVRIKNA